MISVVIGHCNSHTAGEVVIVFTEINKELGGSLPTAARLPETNSVILLCEAQAEHLFINY